MLQGSLVAIVTPMHADGSLDYPRLEALIDWHVAAGTAGIVIVGTTGESPTVSVPEHKALIAAAVTYAAGRIPVIAGTGGNSTKEAIELTGHAREVGADYALSVVPYYNKPTQEGLYQHFRAIAEAVDIPIILYNVPGRTMCDLSNETALRLSLIDNIVGIKDATGDLARGSDLFRRAPRDFLCYTGDDATACPYILMGGHGVISVTANVAPTLMAAMCQAALAGDAISARDAHTKLLSLHRDLFIEANPIPVKWALHVMGRIEPGIRLPLTPLSPIHQDSVLRALREAGIEPGIH